MAIWLVDLPLDRWRQANGLARGEGADAAPFALISDTAQGPRLDAVNPAARAGGVAAGMRLADARALCPELAAALRPGLRVRGFQANPVWEHRLALVIPARAK